MGLVRAQPLGRRIAMALHCLPLLALACAEDEQLLGFRALTAASDSAASLDDAPDATPWGARDVEPTGDHCAFNHACSKEGAADVDSDAAPSSESETPRIEHEAGQPETSPERVTEDTDQRSAAQSEPLMPPEAGPAAPATNSPTAPIITPDARADAAVDSGASHAEPCELLSRYAGNRECSSDIVCASHEANVSCANTAGMWRCVAQVIYVPDPDASMHELGDSKTFAVDELPADASACSVVANLFAFGSPWDPTSGVDCDQDTSVTPNGCTFAPGCWHPLALPEGDALVWESSQPRIECNAQGGDSDTLLCQCEAAAQGAPIEANTPKLELSGSTPIAACLDLKPVCSGEEALDYAGTSECSVQSRLVEAQYCEQMLLCGPSAQLDESVIVRDVTSHEIICAAEDDATSECFCNQGAVGNLSFFVPFAATDDACDLAGRLCYPVPITLPEAAPECAADIVSANETRCEAVLDCTWSATLEDTDVAIRNMTEARCSAEDDTWSCVCGVGSAAVTGVDFEYPDGGDFQLDCQGIAEVCRGMVESGEVLFSQ